LHRFCTTYPRHALFAQTFLHGIATYCHFILVSIGFLASPLTAMTGIKEQECEVSRSLENGHTAGSKPAARTIFNRINHFIAFSAFRKAKVKASSHNRTQKLHLVAEMK
jgi:hypothetical protein